MTTRHVRFRCALLLRCFASAHLWTIRSWLSISAPTLFFSASLNSNLFWTALTATASPLCDETGVVPSITGKIQINYTVAHTTTIELVDVDRSAQKAVGKRGGERATSTPSAAVRRRNGPRDDGSVAKQQTTAHNTSFMRKRSDSDKISKRSIAALPYSEL